MTDALLQKKGIALRALDELRAECRHIRSVTQEATQELLGHPVRQRVDGDLGAVAFPTPVLLVLRPVREEEQDARGGQTVYERVEDGLRLGSIQWRSSSTRHSGWRWLSRRSSRRMASSVRCRRCLGSSLPRRGLRPEHRAA